MMGIFVKDFRMLKIQAKFFLMVLIIGTGLMIGNKNPFAVVAYVMFVFAFSMLSILSYDEAENGMTFLFTLPVSRKGYVCEKYLFSAAVVLMSATLSYLPLVGYLLAKGQIREVGQYFFLTVLMMLVTMSCLSLMLPVLFGFGIEKGRIVLAVVLAAVGSGVFVIGQMLPSFLSKAEKMTESLMQMGKLPVVGIIAAACAVVTAVSCVISIHIMKKKEF